MTERLTPAWTTDLKQAFGEAGAQGTRGELLAMRVFAELGFDPVHAPDDKEMQTSGIDIILNGRYGVDVKNNLHAGGDVCVEQQTLFGSQATFWFHANDNDPDDYVVYKVEDMRAWLNENANPLLKLYWVPRSVANEL